MEGRTTNHKAQAAAGGLLAAVSLLVILLVAGPLSPAAAATTWPQPVASGGGEVALPEADRMTAAQQAEIDATLAANIEMLTAAGLLPPPHAADHVLLGWPLVPRAGFTDPGYHVISGFVDHIPGLPNQLTDYACGGRTYSGHKGTDIYLWPFSWNKMAAGDVTIVAAADGVIIYRNDGNFDQSCEFNNANNNKWNAVYVRHSDGSIAKYGHMKRGSLTSKGIGATVEAGEYLGLVGSSGNSTGPHLHFEVVIGSIGGQLIDPYVGSCNPLEDGSWWASQPNYYDSAVNKLMTGTAPAEESLFCPQPDVTNEATQFQPGDRVTFSAYYRDLLNTLPSLYRIRDPNGAIFTQWSYTITAAHYTTFYRWWKFDLPANATTGAWQFEVEFNGRTYSHTFYVDWPSTPTPTPTPFPDDYPHNYLPGIMRPAAP